MIILNTFSASFKSKFSVHWLRRLVLPIGFSGGLCKGAKYTFIFDFLRNSSMENYLAFDMDKMVDMPTCLLLSLMQLSSTSELTFYKLWWNPHGALNSQDGSWPRNEYFFQHNNFNLQNGSGDGQSIDFTKKYKLHNCMLRFGGLLCNRRKKTKEPLRV